MFMSRHEYAAQNYNFLTANKWFEIWHEVEVLGNNSNKSKLHP